MRTTTPVRTGYGQALARTTTPQQQQQQQQRQAPSGGPSRARSWRWGAPPHVAFLVALAVIVVVYTGAMWATAARAGRAVSGEDREKQQAAHHLQGTAAGPGGPSDHSAARDGRRRTTTARAVLDAWDVRMRDQGGGGPSKATPPASSRPTAGEGGASEDDERRDPGVHDPDVGRSLPPLPHGSRVFVTGAAGFIALHVIEALVALPAVDAVVGMDCYSDYYSRALKEARVARLAARGVRVLNASVCDQELVSTTLRDHGITHVVHLAAQPGIEKSLTHPRMYVRNNVECFVSLLEAVRAQAAPPAVVFASSSSVYGTVPPPFREDQPIRPANVYGATKAHTEMLAHVYHSLYGLRAVGLRFFTVYGPFMRPDMAVYHFSSLIDKGGTVVLKGVCRLWSRLIRGQYHALWGGRLVTIKCANKAPSGRTCHSAVQYNGKMYTIGGMPQSATISCVKKELCILDLAQWRWRVISKCIPAVTEQTTVLYNGAIYLFGGYYEVEGRKSHLYKISGLEDRTPSVALLCEDDVNKPPARSSHTALVYNHRMYVFGGWERVVPKNDLYVLDLINMTWRMVHDNDMTITEDTIPHSGAMGAAQAGSQDSNGVAGGAAHRPSPRRAHTAFSVGHEMLVFGGTTRVHGEDVECRTSSIDVLDMETVTWTLREVHGDIPCPRSRADGAVFEGLFYLAGGWNRAHHLGDFHCFNPATNIWRQLSVATHFGIVQHSVVVWQDKLLMFGGYKLPNSPPPPQNAAGSARKEEELGTASTPSSSSSSSSTADAAPPVTSGTVTPPAAASASTATTPASSFLGTSASSSSFAASFSSALGGGGFAGVPSGTTVTPAVTTLTLSPLALTPPSSALHHSPSAAAAVHEGAQGYTTNDVHLYHLKSAHGQAMA